MIHWLNHPLPRFVYTTRFARLISVTNVTRCVTVLVVELALNGSATNGASLRHFWFWEQLKLDQSKSHCSYFLTWGLESLCGLSNSVNTQRPPRPLNTEDPPRTKKLIWNYKRHLYIGCFCIFWHKLLTENYFFFIFTSFFLG